MPVTVTPAAISVQTPKSSSCCERIKRALGRLWEWIVDCTHWLVDKIFRVVNPFVFGFFRVAEFFSPRFAMRMEAGYGYLSTWYANHISSINQGSLKRQIKDLEALNQTLNRRIENMAAELGHTRIGSNQIIAERRRFQGERDRDIRARQAAIEQRTHAEQECLAMNTKVTSLQKENARLQKEFEELVSQKNSALSERDRLKNTVSALTNDNVLLQAQERHSTNMITALKKSLALVGKLNSKISQFS